MTCSRSLSVFQTAFRSCFRTTFTSLLLATAALPAAHAAERITLTNGFDLVCDHRVADGSRVRLYTDASSYVEVNATEIASAVPVELPPAAPSAPATASAHAVTATPAPAAPASARLSDAEIHQLLAAPGQVHDLDVDLLAAVIKQESGGQTHAVSRTGARGLMQLMPGTASQLGVSDAFVPEQNVGGGTAYLDSLLHRYHDNLPLALAAYNAGPGAVDRWHGIPPYPETRAYVARVIHEFNRRVAQRHSMAAHSVTQVASAAIK
ncbi:lytic transglycosylase domain-containing protein [Silvibacterium dinghuense]|uniref:Lytic transglycosylase domain-containing protein n=1 Tax=Silvibacterium dinghuense TaxID=1560006 RepID=A0A4Q1SBG0_9BACT|nr:lytic transglycosylase domain-containing protein [Silvibacterium dinghuense]RXS94468.1 lytic transglycosylase domain-containing protein [Silvibacterium dinghuense]GGH15911.1 hypothetical protein GCM10011586_37350 [Silvibacterium dinghuense]